MGNFAFTTLRSRILAEADFTRHLLHYIESVIIQILFNLFPWIHNQSFANVLPSSPCLLLTSGLWPWGRTYCAKDRSNIISHFCMPHKTMLFCEIFSLMVIYLARNHPLIYPCSPSSARCLQSYDRNSRIFTVSKPTALVYWWHCEWFCRAICRSFVS